MPDHRAQHYVPQFYLRAFSPDGRRVHLFNLKKSRAILGVSLRDQCKGRNFYKSQGIERTFASIEGDASSVIRRVVSTRSVPDFGQPGYSALHLFTFSQFARTRYASDVVAESFDKIVRSTLSKDARIDRDVLDMVSVDVYNPAGISVRNIAQSLPIVIDLKMKLLVNLTGRSFITSDNPVVLHNQWVEDIPDAGGLGLGSRGLQVFFPLSSDVMLVLYDSLVYSIGTEGSNAVILDHPDDVARLNALQWLFSDQNVYFEDIAELPLLEEQFEAMSPLFLKDKARITEYVSLTPSDRSVIIRLSKPSHGHKLGCSFVGLTPAAFGVPLQGRPGVLRDRWMATHVREFSQACEAGKYRASEFDIFLRDRKNAATGDCS